MDVLTVTTEEEEYAKRVYGACCDLCQDFVVLDKDSPNYEGHKLYKINHTIGSMTNRLVVCADCLDSEPCEASIGGVHGGPVIELDDDEASHFFDSNELWYALHERITGSTRTRYVLCPRCHKVIYWSVNRQRFVDIDVAAMGETVEELCGQFDLDMVRVPVRIMSSTITAERKVTHEDT